MTLYDITKKHAEGKGEDMMWKTVRIISNAVESDMDEHAKDKLIRKIYGAMSDGHYTEELAMADIKNMYYTDGKGQMHKAPYWPEEAVEEIYEAHKDEIPGYNEYDFMVTMNMIASDSWCMLTRWFPNYDANEMNEKIAEMAVNWLADEDWPTKTKIWDYLSSR